MNYIQQRAHEIFQELYPNEEMEEEELYQLYALVSLILERLGFDVLDADIHDAWALWEMKTNPGHPSIVPFDELTQETQDKDNMYTQAVNQVLDRQ